MSGDWHDLGGSLAEDASEPVALQPLAGIDAEEERAWAAEWVAAILAREKVYITPDVTEHVRSALDKLASAPKSERTLTGLSVLPQSQAQIGSASCRERVCQYVTIQVVAVSFQKTQSHIT